MKIARFVVLGAILACAKPAPPAPDASPPAQDAAAAFDPMPILRAADRRRAKDVPPELDTSHDVLARRLAARALARIADADSLMPLRAHLSDADPETVAWAAYGLGYGCKGHEEAHVKLLASRAVTLTAKKPAGRNAVDPYEAIARAMGRCGAGSLGEQALLDRLHAGEAWEEAALLGLGDLASRRKQLGPDSMTALLESKSPTAFYALSRADAGDAFGRRVFDVSKAALAKATPERLLAIKTLARAGKIAPKEGASELARVVTEKGFSTAERSEAARGLGNLGRDGNDAAADALARITPDRNDAVAIQALVGDEFHVLYTLIGSTGAEPPKKAESALGTLASLASSSEPSPALASRLARLRCAAALGLARGAYDAEVLRKCTDEKSEISERARLDSLLRRPITEARKNAFQGFWKSEHLRIREGVVEAIGEHAELNDLLTTNILTEALSSEHAGLVATTAEMLQAHPDRAMVLSEKEKKAALDPKAPPPSVNPVQEISASVSKALGLAMAREWKKDAFETRTALLDAAAALKHPGAASYATKACTDPNPVVREHASRALRSLGEKVTACDKAPVEITPAKELGALRSSETRVLFQTSIGDLFVVLEPELSPVTATRIASLVESGFYDGIFVHRVVPGFVAQLGDPEADGYGGSGESLRCETSPVPFALLDVGMALAGRDTGSSQIFVTLSRTPHLDGEYTRVGRAEGEWSRLAEGDSIVKAILK